GGDHLVRHRPVGLRLVAKWCCLVTGHQLGLVPVLLGFAEALDHHFCDHRFADPHAANRPPGSRGGKDGRVQCRSPKSAAPYAARLRCRPGGVDRAHSSVGLQAAGHDPVWGTQSGTRSAKNRIRSPCRHATKPITPNIIRRPMLTVALKMLTGDRGKYVGLILGLAFTSFFMTQQPALFLGILNNAYGFILDAGQADLWVMDPHVQYSRDIKPLSDTMIGRVRGIEGVGWAVPIYIGNAGVRLRDGTFQSSVLIGLDDAML